MKCANCGAEIKEGCLFCSICGHEAQMVTGYSVLEEDYLKSILKDEAEKDTSNQPETTKKTGKKKKKSYTPWIIVAVVAFLGIVIAISAVSYVNYKNNNSYDYQMEMASKELVDRNYENALSYYKNALSILPDDIDARLAMADIYVQQKELDSAMVLYMEVITLEEKNLDAYKGLIAIYEEKEEYDKIKELSNGITDTDILELFSGYIVAEPVLYPDEGSYDTYTVVTIFSIEEFDIYYTIDGSDPTTDGILYTEDGISFEKSGSYTVKAACVNEKGIYSDVVTCKYDIQAKAPDYPTVTPDGGTVGELSYVVIEAQDNCSIYYTWDGTDPTAASTLYTEPIEVPAGNNILSIIVIDNKTKLTSGIYRANFIYKP